MLFYQSRGIAQVDIKKGYTDLVTGEYLHQEQTEFSSAVNIKQQ